MCMALRRIVQVVHTPNLGVNIGFNLWIRSLEILLNCVVFKCLELGLIPDWLEILVDVKSHCYLRVSSNAMRIARHDQNLGKQPVMAWVSILRRKIVLRGYWLDYPILIDFDLFFHDCKVTLLLRCLLSKYAFQWPLLHVSLLVNHFISKSRIIHHWSLWLMTLMIRIGIVNSTILQSQVALAHVLCEWTQLWDIIRRELLGSLCVVLGVQGYLLIRKFVNMAIVLCMTLLNQDILQIVWCLMMILRCIHSRLQKTPIIVCCSTIF